MKNSAVALWTLMTKPFNTKIFKQFALVLLLAQALVVQANCSRVASEADDAYTYSRRALRETDFDSAKNYMRRAKNSADDANSLASACRCSNVKNYTDDAYTYARRGYNSSDLSELLGYAKRAMNAAESAMDAARACR